MGQRCLSTAHVFSARQMVEIAQSPEVSEQKPHTLSIKRMQTGTQNFSGYLPCGDCIHDQLYYQLRPQVGTLARLGSGTQLTVLPSPRRPCTLFLLVRLGSLSFRSLLRALARRLHSLLDFLQLRLESLDGSSDLLILARTGDHVYVIQDCPYVRTR